jgi:hypothetical protein
MEVVRQLELMVGGQDAAYASRPAAPSSARQPAGPTARLRSVPAPKREKDVTTHDTGTFGRF